MYSHCKYSIVTNYACWVHTVCIPGQETPLYSVPTNAALTFLAPQYNMADLTQANK